MYGVCNTMVVNLSWLLCLVVFAGLFPFDLSIGICTVPSLLFMVLCFFLPESPLWYVKKGKLDKAEKTLIWLRGPKYPVTMELKELMHCLNQEDQGKVTLKEKIGYFSSRAVRTPIAMMLVMFFFLVRLKNILYKIYEMKVDSFIDCLWMRVHELLLPGHLQEGWSGAASLPDGLPPPGRLYPGLCRLHSSHVQGQQETAVPRLCRTHRSFNGLHWILPPDEGTTLSYSFLL